MTLDCCFTVWQLSSGLRFSALRCLFWTIGPGLLSHFSSPSFSQSPLPAVFERLQRFATSSLIFSLDLPVGIWWTDRRLDQCPFSSSSAFLVFNFTYFRWVWLVEEQSLCRGRFRLWFLGVLCGRRPTFGTSFQSKAQNVNLDAIFLRRLRKI